MMESEGFVGGHIGRRKEKNCRVRFEQVRNMLTLPGLGTVKFYSRERVGAVSVRNIRVNQTPRTAPPALMNLMNYCENFSK